MMRKKSFWLKLLLLLCLLPLVACQGQKSATKDSKESASTEKTEAADEKDADQAEGKVTIAVNGDANRIIWEDVKKRLKADGVDLDIKSMTGWVSPNVAVKDDEADLNCFQYIPFLKDFNDSHNADLVPIGYAFLPPISIYAVPEIKSLDDIPDGAKFALPEDPVNLGHSLLEIENAGLIKLKDSEATDITLDDVVENPKNLDFILLDGPNIARALGDVDLMITGSTVARDAELSEDQAIYTEDVNKTTNYYKVTIVAKRERKDDPLLKKVVEAYNDPATVEAMKKNFDDTVLPAWSDDDHPVEDYDGLVEKLAKEK